jgi:hypothetical protein
MRPFKVKSNKIGRAIFGGAGGYKRQKEDSVPLSATSCRNSDSTLSEMKVYDILQTSKSYETEAVSSRDYFFDKHHHDKITHKPGTERGKHNRSSSHADDHHRRSSSSSQRMLFAFDQDEPAVSQRQNFPPGIVLDGKAIYKADDPVDLFQESRLAGPRESGNNTNAVNRPYPRHVNLSRAKVMPTNDADDRAFDDIVTRGGDESPTAHISLRTPTAFSMVPPSPHDMSPLLPRALDAPWSDKASISRDPPGPFTARASPTGDHPVSEISSFQSGRRVIPIVEVPNPTMESRIAIRRDARSSPLSCLTSDISPRYPSRRFNDGGEFQVASERVGSPYRAQSPLKHHHSGERRWLESHGPIGPPYPRRHSGSHAKSREFPDSFVPTSARDSSVSAVQDQVAFPTTRLGERVTSLPVETQRHTNLETTAPRMHNRVEIPVHETISNAGAPYNPSGRRLTRHAWRQNPQPTHLSVASAPMQQEQATDDIDWLAERNPICSNTFVDSTTVPARSYFTDAANIRQQQHEQPVNDLFEQSKPVATVTSSVVDVSGSSPGPREHRCFGADFSAHTMMHKQRTTNSIDGLAERKATSGNAFADSSTAPARNYYTATTNTREQHQEQPTVDLFDLGKEAATLTLSVVEAAANLPGPKENRGYSVVDFNTTQKRGMTENIPTLGLPEHFAEKISIDCEANETHSCWPSASSAEVFFDDKDTAAINLIVPMNEPQSSNMFHCHSAVDREPLSEFRRVLNTDDPNQCTFWVTDAIGECQYLEIHVETAKPDAMPKPVENSLATGNENLISMGEDNRMQRSSSRLWNEGSIHFQGKGYGKVEDDASLKSCLTPSNKKTNRRKLKASSSFRAQTNKGRLGRNFSFSSVR